MNHKNLSRLLNLIISIKQIAINVIGREPEFTLSPFILAINANKLAASMAKNYGLPVESDMIAVPLEISTFHSTISKLDRFITNFENFTKVKINPEKKIKYLGSFDDFSNNYDYPESIEDFLVKIIELSKNISTKLIDDYFFTFPIINISIPVEGDVEIESIIQKAVQECGLKIENSHIQIKVKNIEEMEEVSLKLYLLNERIVENMKELVDDGYAPQTILDKIENFLKS